MRTLNKLGFINLFLLLFVACSDKKENNAKIIWEKYENGNYRVVFQYCNDTANLGDDYYYQEFYENGNLKLQGLENQRIRKGEWNYYYDNGKLKSKMNFVNDTLRGTITLFNQEGKIIAEDKVENGALQGKNTEVIRFIKADFNLTEQRPAWIDSLNIMVDSLNKFFEEK